MKYITTYLILLICPFLLNAQDWESRADLPVAKHHGVGFTLNDKGYFVTGGGPDEFVSGNVSKQFFTYDPALDEWEKLADFPGLARSYAAGLAIDGKGYMGFGRDKDGNYLNDLWSYDADTETWTELASCPCQNRIHPAFVANQGKIFMGLGGEGNYYENLKDWWEYDIATDTWTQKTDLPAYKRHHPYQFAIDDYVYTGLGHGNDGDPDIYKDWFRYDPTTDEWTQMADLPAEGRVAGTQFDYNGKGYVLSGEGEDHDIMELGEFWEYDPILNEWTELPPHPGSSRWAPASFIIDGHVYMVSGQDESGNVNTVYSYYLGEPALNNNTPLNSQSIAISPNPANDILSISLSQEVQQNIEKITLYDVTGQLILEKDSNLTAIMDLQVADLEKGIYLLSIEVGGEVYTERIVKL